MPEGQEDEVVVQLGIFRPICDKCHNPIVPSVYGWQHGEVLRLHEDGKPQLNAYGELIYERPAGSRDHAVIFYYGRGRNAIDVYQELIESM